MFAEFKLHYVCNSSAEKSRIRQKSNFEIVPCCLLGIHFISTCLIDVGVIG